MARQWERLSEPYRRRLERAGVTRDAYEHGESLAKARGHGKTPERPSRAYKSPGRYREYLKKRMGPVDYREPPPTDPWVRAEKNMKRRAGRAPYIHLMSRAEAEWTANATGQAIARRASTQYKGNPWFYHA